MIYRGLSSADLDSNETADAADTQDPPSGAGIGDVPRGPPGDNGRE